MSAMKAIRIDKKEILYGKRHVELLTDYMTRENLTIDETDVMIDEGRFEFGGVFLNKDGTLDWSSDETRDSVYKSVYDLYYIGGR